MCALIALGVTSCQKDIEQNNGDYQFRATMENCSSDSKTTFNGTAIQWNQNDTVMIYGLVPGRYIATPEQGNPGVAKLRRLGEEIIPYMGDEVTAIYPAALANSATSITLPALQETEDGNLMSNFPMIATSSDENLAFKNLCGVLKLNLQKENVNISSIQVSVEEGKNINGNFNVRQSGIVPTMTYVANGSNTTTLTCSEAQAIDETKSFFIYMPHGTYTNMQIVITTDDNRTCTKTLKANKSVYIGRSQYTEINLGSESLNF